MGKKSRIPLGWVLLLVCLAVLALVDLPIWELLGESVPVLLGLLLFGAGVHALYGSIRAWAKSLQRDDLSHEERQARRRLAKLLATMIRVQRTEVVLKCTFSEAAHSDRVREARAKAAEAASTLKVVIARERAILLSIEVHRWRKDLHPLLQILQAEGEWPSARREAAGFERRIAGCLNRLNQSREQGLGLRGRIRADKELARLPLAQRLDELLRSGLEEAALVRGNLLGVRSDLKRLCRAGAPVQDPETNAHRFAEVIRTVREQSGGRATQTTRRREEDVIRQSLYH